MKKFSTWLRFARRYFGLWMRLTFLVTSTFYLAIEAIKVPDGFGFILSSFFVLFFLIPPCVSVIFWFSKYRTKIFQLAEKPMLSWVAFGWFFILVYRFSKMPFLVYYYGLIVSLGVLVRMDSSFQEELESYDVERKLSRTLPFFLLLFGLAVGMIWLWKVLVMCWLRWPMTAAL